MPGIGGFACSADAAQAMQIIAVAANRLQNHIPI
jgi:hypothetical protein